MFYSLNLLEAYPIAIINIYFFFIFFAVLVLGYPMGRYLLSNYCENSLIKNSFFSITIFSLFISIAINLTPILAKYVIIIFYLTNLFILGINSKIRNDLGSAIISFKFVLLGTFFTFLIFNLIYEPIFVENGKLNFFFDSHLTYFVNPVNEIFTSDYFSRIKILSLYTSEWSSFHFFQASINSIFLSPIYLSGTIGLITLKNFYVSIFVSLFCFSFFKDRKYTKKEYKIIILKVFLIISLFVFLFFPIIFFLITTNYFTAILSIIFIIESFFSKNKNDLLIWTIILVISSSTNIFIGSMIALYYLLESRSFNFKIFINKVKKNLNLPNLLLIILFLFEMLSAFYQSEFTQPRFNLPTSQSWWWLTITYSIIENYKFFFITLILLITVHLFLSKLIFNKKSNFTWHFNKQYLFYFSIVLIIPFIYLILLFFENAILDIYNMEKLKIFFESLSIASLSFYFFVPLLWCFVLLCTGILFRYLFITAILIYTFLSTFIYNPFVLPAFFTLEILILFFIFHILIDFKRNKKKTFSYLFIVSVIISVTFQLNFYETYTISSYKGSQKLVIKIKDLKEFNKRKYLCPQDVKFISSYKFTGSVLSAILLKPYYTDISITDKRANWENASSRWAVPPKTKVNNPCTSK